MTRKDHNLPYTSNVKEANVKSQIKARLKRKQEMQLNSENAHNVLQVRITIYLNEWARYQNHIDLQLAAQFNKIFKLPISKQYLLLAFFYCYTHFS